MCESNQPNIALKSAFIAVGTRGGFADMFALVETANMPVTKTFSKANLILVDVAAVKADPALCRKTLAATHQRNVVVVLYRGAQSEHHEAETAIVESVMDPALRAHLAQQALRVLCQLHKKRAA